MRPRLFRTAAEFRSWLEGHHASAREIWLRLRRMEAPGRGVTYSEALDLALCFGWIDGVRRSLDDWSFAVRFSPRQPRSIWSKVNLRRFEQLVRSGLVAPAGRQAFRQRDPARSGLYSFESRPRDLPPAYSRLFRSRPAAWSYFAAQPPSYRRTAIFWVVSAKLEPTRRRRLAELIADSSQSRRLKMLTRRPKTGCHETGAEA